MATQNASNQKFTNQADGFVLGGGTTQRNLTVTGANVTLTGSGSNTHTFPASSQTLVGRSSTDTLTNKTIDANGTGNSITNLEVADFASGVIDTDLSSVSGSDDTLPSAKATKAALDGKRAAFMTGTIATAVGTAAKTVTLNSPWASHTPAAGDMYLFTYTNGTNAASATIAINGGSALAVRIANAAATAVPHTTAAGGVMLYYFDGTSLHLIGSQRNSDTDTNTTYVSTPTTFTSVTGTSQAAAVNNAYQANNAAQVVFTLPGTAAVGNVVVVSGLGAGGWRINAPAGDTIRVGATVSASGGYIASNNRYDSITLMCIVANADWVAVDYTGLVSVDGTIALDPALIDEDSFATDTDRRAPTQQSVKAYIASQINAIPAATMTLTNKTFDANGTGNSISNLEVADFAGSAYVTESEGIANNDNDTAFPTSAAVKDYVDWNTPGHKVPVGRTFWRAKANTGTMPSTEDTGQAVTLYDGNADSEIASGRYTYAPGSGVAASYWQVNPGAEVTRIGAKFVLGHSVGSTTGGAIALAAGNSERGAWTNATRYNIHVVISPTSWNVATATRQSGSSVLNYKATGTFSPALSIGDTEYTVEVYRVGNTVTLFLPDGTVSVTTDAEYSSFTGNWSFVELFASQGSTDNVPGITEHWWDTGTQYPPSNKSTIPGVYTDDVFTIRDNGDSTKQLQFQLSGITAGQTRTMTIPDASTTLVGADTTQTLTNKTLTTPRVATFLDASGNGAANFSATPSAVNYVQFVSGATGAPMSVRATGSDTNIGLNLRAKGTGIVSIGASGIEVVGVSGSQTLIDKTISGSSNTFSNIPLTSVLSSTSTPVGVGSIELGHATDTTLARGAAGRLTVEGINVPTVSSTDTLTNKTLSAPRVDIIDDINGMAILGLYETASAVNFLGIHNRTTTNEPYISANGTDADINIGLVPKGDGDVRIYKSSGEVRIYANGGDANVDLNLQTKGTGVVKAKGIELATISSSQTLTNKTLTNPRINSIFDTNSNSILGLYGITSAVNQYYVTNQSAGNYPTIGVEGSDTNIGIVFAPKGAGPVRIYSPSGQTATIDVAGPDTNIDIDLKPKGSGIVKISGAPLLSAAGAATLTNKTISGANNTLTALPYDLTAVAFGYVSPRAVGVGDFPFGIKLQRACTLTSVTYRCNTADASGNLVVELRKNGVAVSGSSASIAAASQVAGGTSTGSWSFSAGDILTVYVTAVGTTPGNGLIADITGVTA